MPVSPRTSFNSSQLVRLLAGLGGADVAASKQTFAERLSPWLDWTDAISLSGALVGAPTGPAQGSAAARPAAPAPGVRVRARAAFEEFQRVRTELARAIAADPGLAAGAGVDASADASVGFSELRRLYLGHQRAMETRLVPLRADLRAALSAASADLGRLAALDAVLERALGTRERHLLATVPGWLEKHFNRSRKAVRATVPAVDGPYLQWVLLAELDVRLQPIEGLIDALAEALGVAPATPVAVQDTPQDSRPAPRAASPDASRQSHE